MILPSETRLDISPAGSPGPLGTQLRVPKWKAGEGQQGPGGVHVEVGPRLAARL